MSKQSIKSLPDYPVLYIDHDRTWYKIAVNLRYCPVVYSMINTPRLLPEMEDSGTIFQVWIRIHISFYCAISYHKPQWWNRNTMAVIPSWHRHILQSCYHTIAISHHRVIVTSSYLTIVLSYNRHISSSCYYTIAISLSCYHTIAISHHRVIIPSPYLIIVLYHTIAISHHRVIITLPYLTIRVRICSHYPLIVLRGE